MSLTERERRALRAIDEALSAEDPALAALLRGTPSPASARAVERIARVAVYLGLVLLLLGLLLDEMGLRLTGLLMLVVPRLTISCVSAALRQDG